MAAIAVLLVVVAAGTVSGDDKRGIAGADDAPISGSTTVPTGTVPTGETTSTVPGVNADPLGYNVTGLTVPVSTIPALATAPSGAPIVKTSLASSLYIGTSGPDVTALQNRLTELGFVPGKIDGYFGQMTREAVWAYEKLILQTPSDKATGKVTNTMWQGMQDSIVVQPRRSGSGTHVEIYLPQQVAAVFTDDKATLVIHISSGAAITSQRTPDNAWCETIHLDTDENGQPLDPPLDKPVCGIAYTPGGVFTFKRELQGDHVGPLGGMYNPVYFNYGIAMHGAKKVPLTPASHGCIRMNETISNTFQNFVHIHDRVYVWGWDGKEPEQYTKRESTPIFNFDDPNATTTTSTTIKTTTTTAKPTATTAKPTTETTTKAPTTTTTVKAAPTTTTTPAPTTTAAPATTAAAATQTTAAPSG